MEDLEEAILVMRQAIEVKPDSHPHQAAIMSTLGNRLESRYKCTGNMEDLEEAIQVTRQAIEVTPDNDPDLADIEQHIKAAVDHLHILYLGGADTVYQKLVALKKRLAPTNRARELEVTCKYRDLLRTPRISDHEKCLRQWDRVYAEAQLSLRTMLTPRRVYALLHAVQSRNRNWVEAMIRECPSNCAIQRPRMLL